MVILIWNIASKLGLFMFPKFEAILPRKVNTFVTMALNCNIFNVKKLFSQYLHFVASISDEHNTGAIWNIMTMLFMMAQYWLYYWQQWQYCHKNEMFTFCQYWTDIGEKYFSLFCKNFQCKANIFHQYLHFSGSISDEDNIDAIMRFNITISVLLLWYIFNSSLIILI